MNKINKENIIIDWAQNYFESGHGYIEDYEEFKQSCRDEGIKPSQKLYNYYQELIDLGPAGFYETFKDEKDFDPYFIQEYGDEDKCDDEEEDENE